MFNIKFYERHKCNSRKATYCRLHNSPAPEVSLCVLDVSECECVHFVLALVAFFLSLSFLLHFAPRSPSQYACRLNAFTNTFYSLGLSESFFFFFSSSSLSPTCTLVQVSTNGLCRIIFIIMYTFFSSSSIHSVRIVTIFFILTSDSLFHIYVFFVCFRFTTECIYFNFMETHTFFTKSPSTLANSIFSHRHDGSHLLRKEKSNWIIF